MEQQPGNDPKLKIPFPKGPLIAFLLILLMGLALIIWPEALLQVLPVFIGVVLMVVGVISLASSIRMNSWAPEPGMRMMLGIVTLVVGLVFLLKQDISMVFLSVLFGLYVLLTAAMSYADTFREMRSGGPWLFQLLQSIVQTILGLLLLFSPFSGLSLWVQILGVHFVVLAVTSFYWLYKLWKSGGNML